MPTLFVSLVGSWARISRPFPATPTVVLRVPELAAELVRSNVDLIWTGGDFTIAASQAATSKIPIVFFAASDPVNSGFALTLARPGKNLTGVSGMYHELNAKRLELFHTAVPSAKRVAIIAHPNDPQKSTYRY